MLEWRKIEASALKEIRRPRDQVTTGCGGWVGGPVVIHVKHHRR